MSPQLTTFELTKLQNLHLRAGILKEQEANIQLQLQIELAKIGQSYGVEGDFRIVMTTGEITAADSLSDDGQFPPTQPHLSQS